MTCERQEDVYIRPRYPVDEPPTYRAQCSCGWTGPERYRWITDSDWERHNREGGTVTEMSAAEAATVARFEAAEPAPESWSGLREAVFLAVREAVETSDDLSAQTLQKAADAVLALPEVAALRAKAAGYDRVEELAETWERRSRAYAAADDRDKVRDLRARATALRIALDGADRTDRGRC